MPYFSRDKSHRNDSQVRDIDVEAASRASMAAASPNSPGDGAATWSLSPTPDPIKPDRFKEDAD